MSEIKVSVAVITYNQQDTIRQTLDSILAQKGDFALEVVVGEDCSKDGTWSICKMYADRYPAIIKLLENTGNLGITANFARVMNACGGDYVAICAGDDYWCDDQKLQKQLDYAQNHPEFGVVCTNGYRLLVRSGELVPGLPPFKPAPDGDVSGYYKERYGGVYAMPLTLLIRRDLLQFVDFDEFIRRGFPVEDYPMQSVLAHHTRFGYIPDKTVVYRVCQESATFTSFYSPRYMDYHRGLADIRRYLHGLYPEDVPFTEEWAADYVFYKEFLSLLIHKKYREARKLVASHHQDTPHHRQAARATKTILHFYAFRAYKSFVLKRDRNQRT